MKYIPIITIYLYVIFYQLLSTYAQAQQLKDTFHYEKYECCKNIESKYMPRVCNSFKLTNEKCKKIYKESAQYIAETKNKLLSELKNAKQKWDLNNIDKYEISLSYSTPWYQEKVKIKVTKDISELISQKCTSMGKPSSSCHMNTSSATIASLFKKAKSQIDRLAYERILKIVYDDKYGYPKIISSDRLDITDSGASYYVEKFKLLEF